MNKEESFDHVVKDLQKKIHKEEKKAYSSTVIQEYRNPTNFGFIPDADLRGELTGPCGDTMAFSLKLKENKILNAKFVTDGCGATVACGNMLTKMITGLSLEEAKRITEIQLLEVLGGLPEEHNHCATLAIMALQKAITHRRK